MSDESIPAGEVIEIDPEGKYILVFPMRLTDDELHDYKMSLDQWLDGDAPFLMVDGGVKVIRLERDDEEKDN